MHNNIIVYNLLTKSESTPRFVVYKHTSSYAIRMIIADLDRVLPGSANRPPSVRPGHRFRSNRERKYPANPSFLDAQEDSWRAPSIY
jgi:hypothetical protein